MAGKTLHLSLGLVLVVSSSVLCVVIFHWKITSCILVYGRVLSLGSGFDFYGETIQQARKQSLFPLFFDCVRRGPSSGLGYWAPSLTTHKSTHAPHICYGQRVGHYGSGFVGGGGWGESGGWVMTYGNDSAR